MGTRCVTIFRNVQRNWQTDEEERVELLRFYRHWDGYPGGHGRDIAWAIQAANDDEGKDNRNWAQHVLAHLFSADADMELEGHDDEHGDLDYIYVVDGRYANYGGKHEVDEFAVMMSIYRCHYGAASYDDVFSEEPIYEGTAGDFLKSLAREGEA